MPSTIYQKLDSSLREIRLLSPASLENGTTWKLTTFALETSPQFTALSYLWGNAAEKVDIEVNGQLIPVTSSLALALRHITCHWRQQFPCRPVVEFRLWADALCINQNDVKEREEQARLMATLYSTAEIVMSSLGPSTEAMEVSFDTVHLVHSEFDANKSWRRLREFLYMPYWRRAWVVQELVLAKSLLFFSESQTLDPGALFATLQWFQGTKQIAKDQVVRRPHWLIPSVWNFLTYDNLLGWKAILRIYSARTQDHNSRSSRLILSCAGSDLQATDPRDLIYGTMGLTQMGFDPDYSTNSSLGVLYAKFMAWWLDEVTALQTEDSDWTFNHLDLLGEAGIGQVDDNDENIALARSLPSWIPNFPLHGKIYTPHILISPKTAQASIFPEDAPLPQVKNLSLFVPAIILDNIVPSLSVETLIWVEGWLSLLLQPAWDGKWSSPAVLDLCLRVVLEIRELNYTSIAETSKGYLCIVPIGTNTADQVCLMHKNDSASVIRDKGGYWEHVGRCYSFGLSEFRTQEFTSSISKYEILELL